MTPSGYREFEIPGPTVGKGRARSTKSGHHYTPGKTADYENLVKLCWSGPMIPRGSAIRVHMTAYCTFPKSRPKRDHRRVASGVAVPVIVTPDLTNIAKSVEDGLNGVAWHDDAAIWNFWARKVYADDGRARVAVRLWWWPWSEDVPEEHTI